MVTHWSHHVTRIDASSSDEGCKLLLLCLHTSARTHSSINAQSVCCVLLIRVLVQRAAFITVRCIYACHVMWPMGHHHTQQCTLTLSSVALDCHFKCWVECWLWRPCLPSTSFRPEWKVCCSFLIVILLRMMYLYTLVDTKTVHSHNGMLRLLKSGSTILMICTIIVSAISLSYLDPTFEPHLDSVILNAFLYNLCFQHA